MKFTVTMKDPDTLQDAIREAVKNDVEATTAGLDDEEREAVVEQQRFEKVQKVCERWFRYGEYLSVEVDTDAQTCTVLRNKW